MIIDRETIFEEQHINKIIDANIKSVLFHREESSTDYSVIFNTLQKDPANSEKQAIEYIYLQLRNTAAPDEEAKVASTTTHAFSVSTINALT